MNISEMVVEKFCENNKELVDLIARINNDILRFASMYKSQYTVDDLSEMEIDKYFDVLIAYYRCQGFTVSSYQHTITIAWYDLIGKALAD